MKTVTKGFIVFLILVTIFVLGIIVFFRSKGESNIVTNIGMSDTQRIPTKNSITDTINNQTYTSTKYNFQFDYPNELSLSVRTLSGDELKYWPTGELISLNDGKQFSGSVSVNYPGKSAPKTILAEKSINFGPYASSITFYVYDGVPVSYKGDRWASAFFTDDKGNRFYFLFGYQDFDNKEDLITKILSSFRFTQ